MIDSAQVVNLVTNCFIAAFGLLLFRIAAGAWHARFAREALLCAAAYVLTTFTVRVFSILELITPAAARDATGFVALGFVAILAQIIWLQRALHNSRNGGTK